jgi:hypothetical protein
VGQQIREFIQNFVHKLEKVGNALLSLGIKTTNIMYGGISGYAMLLTSAQTVE